MSKQEEHSTISEAEIVPEQTETTEQAVETEEVIAKKADQSTASDAEKPAKSGGKGLALLALLVAVAIGATGHYFANRKFHEVEAQLQQLSQQATPQTITQPDFAQEKAEIARLQNEVQHMHEKTAALEQHYAAALQQIDSLKTQVKKLGSAVEIEPTVWILSDADFLLNNALRKLVLENDIDTAKMLINEADKVLAEVNSSEVANVRQALKGDLAQLNSLNEINQNELMQRLAQLANLVDEMPLLENELEENTPKRDEISASVTDWQSNLEKSVSSFLDHFIRVNDKTVATDKGFIAPNQEIYLRENIRLRLQIAILAVPRQHNELYKQSLDAVSTWVRSYFDVDNEHVKTFLTELDELMDQSIYVDAPNSLQSLQLLEKLLNKPARKLEKIQLESEKSLEQLKVEETPKTDAAQPVTESGKTE